MNPKSRIEKRVASDSSVTAPHRGRHLLVGLVVLLFLSGGLQAQGILTVTPGRTASTSAGTGTLGYSGDGGPAISAAVANPSAVAYDTNGNLYLADTQNHVVRMLSVAGIITTVAGTGLESFGGDGGPATSAFLDTPTGVAVDASNNLYIADSHNHRIRMVAGGTITTIAGTGIPGFSGDSAAATLASLSLPSGVAVDASGSLYIADTNNQRVRKITAGIITTIAGNGEELLAGDGSAAVLASLDKPTSIAIDRIGNLYLADSHNHRIRMVGTNGIISTVAGSGPASFAGGFTGDGGSAVAASLAKPSGIFVDVSGTLYVADTDNQRIRQVGGGSIAPLAGTGEQSFGGDGGPLTGAILNAPKAVIADASGNVLIADTLNQRLRGGALPILTFAGQGIGVASTAQSVTLSNTGSGSITVASVAFSGAFRSDATGTCSAVPVTLAAGASCTEEIVFFPSTTGVLHGAVTFSGTGVVPQTVLLTGSAAQFPVTTTLATSMTPALSGQSLTFTSTVTATTGTPTGTVSFFDGTVLIGSAQMLTGGTASLTDAALADGVHSITAVYSGDANFIPSTSPALAQTVEDFTLAFASSSSGSSSTVIVLPGKAAVFSFTVLPVDVPFTYPVVLSATGLPPGATVTFAPTTLTLGASPVTFTMTVQVPPVTASASHRTLLGGGTLALGLLLLPFARRIRKTRKWRPLTFCLLGLIGLAASGCGTSSGFFAQPQQSYTIQVIGTAIGADGATLQRHTTVTLTVQ